MREFTNPADTAHLGADGTYRHKKFPNISEGFALFAVLSGLWGQPCGAGKPIAQSPAT